MLGSLSKLLESSKLIGEAKKQVDRELQRCVNKENCHANIIADWHPAFCLQSLLSLVRILLSPSTEKRELDNSESGRRLRKRRPMETHLVN